MPVRVLLGNELGRGMGHAAILVRVARALEQVGAQPVLALRDPEGAGQLTRGLSYDVIQAPLPVDCVPRRPVAPGSMAEILARLGFADLDALSAGLARWDRLIADIAPAVIVAEYAPFLTLASAGGPPCVALGTGFTLPPPELDDFPRFRRQVPDDERDGAALVPVVTEVQRRRGRPAFPALPAMLAGAACFVCSLPQLDPFTAVRRTPVAGPLAAPPAMSPDVGAGLFVYLHGAAPGRDEILLGLRASGLPGRIYVHGQPAAAAAALEGSALRWESAPVAIDEAIRGARLVVHHGGHGVAERVLLAGRPQLMLSMYLEQALNGQAIAGLGAGWLLRSHQHQAAQVAETLAAAYCDEGARQRAAEAGRTIAAGYPVGCLDSVVAACLRLAAG